MLFLSRTLHSCWLEYLALGRDEDKERHRPAKKESVDFIREFCHPDKLYLRGGIAIKVRLAAEEANLDFHIRVRIKSTDHMSSNSCFRTKQKPSSRLRTSFDARRGASAVIKCSSSSFNPIHEKTVTHLIGFFSETEKSRVFGCLNR